MTIEMRASMRAAAVTMLKAYGSSASLTLQVYPGRPRSVNPPTAFVDRLTGTFDTVGISLTQTTPRVEVIVLHGLFDTADTADQADAFVDGFAAYVQTQFHAAGANTLIAAASYEDEPDYVPDWIEGAKTYYATRITLEGYASG